MLKSRFEWIILLIIAAMLGGAWIVVSREPVTPEAGPITLTEAPIVGHLAPDFTLQTPLGEQVALSEIMQTAAAGGQPVVLNFWASWCAPCRVEMPHLQQASVKYNGRAAIIGVNQGESARTVTDFAAEQGVTYPLLVDSDMTINQLYDVRGLPTTLFIDAEGVVREVVIGTVTQAVLEDRVESLLAEVGEQ
ncbi:MAG: TlpA family protein disulfide reductase [Chloroflexi bacterium]|nr:TlpA family protein disulfide reductase [Chloroflexota bacterium]